MFVKYVDMCQDVVIANSEGVYAEDQRVKTRLSVTAYAQGPKAKRADGIFYDMPSVVDKEDCYTKYEGRARCWGKCIAACPVGN